MERYIVQWAYALEGCYESTDPYEASTYQDWKDRYKPDGLSGTEWESRYRLHFDATGHLGNAAESDKTIRSAQNMRSREDSCVPRQRDRTLARKLPVTAVIPSHESHEGGIYVRTEMYRINQDN